MKQNRLLMPKGCVSCSKCNDSNVLQGFIFPIEVLCGLPK